MKDAGAAPYREPASRVVTSTVVHYRPGASLWTALLVLMVTLPLAHISRRQLPDHQRTVTCSTLSKQLLAGLRPGQERGAHCTAWDRRTGDVREVPCVDAAELLTEAMAAGATRPSITAVTTVSPIESVPIPMKHNTIDGLSAAAFSHVPAASASDAKVAAAWNAVPRGDDGAVSVAGAKELFAICTGAPPAEKEYRTIALLIVPRDDRAAFGVAAFGLALLLWLVLRSGAKITIDAKTSELLIREWRGPFAKPAVCLDVRDIEEVTIAHGAIGPFAGRRIEVVLRNGERIPLVSVFGPIASGPHERALASLRSALRLSRTT